MSLDSSVQSPHWSQTNKSTLWMHHVTECFRKTHAGIDELPGVEEAFVFHHTDVQASSHIHS